MAAAAGDANLLDAQLSRLARLQTALTALAGEAESGADAGAVADELASVSVLLAKAVVLRHEQQRQWASSICPPSAADARAAELAARTDGGGAAAAPDESEERKTAPEKPKAAAPTGPSAAEIEARQRKALSEITEGGTLTMYLQSGKKKHDRVFWLENEQRTVCWDKKKTKPGKANKSGTLRSYEPAPAVKTAREWFDLTDADNSGELDAEELVQLYQSARGEKLKKKDLKAAMAEMDTDGGGTIDFAEFEMWWSNNGGDLEFKRPLAITIMADDVQLLVVAKDQADKQRWVMGLEAALKKMGS